MKTVFSGWRASFKTATEYRSYRREFLLAMIEFRITTEEQLERGIVRARHEASKGREFMPSGAQFAGWCQPAPEELGIGTFEQTFLAAIKCQWEKTHPAFQHVARSFDMYTMRRLSDREARREFRPLFDQVIQRVSSGEQFTRITAIAKKSVTTTNPTPARIQSGNEALAKIKAMVGVKRSPA